MSGLISIWFYLVALTFGIWAFVWAFKKRKLKNAWKVGLFLAVFDLAFETGGAILGLWTTQNSVFPLGYVPVEVFAIAFMAGMVYHWIIPKKLNPRQLFAVLFLIAVAGTLFEAMLVFTGYVDYANWISYFTLPVYFGAFWLVHQVHRRV